MANFGLESRRTIFNLRNTKGRPGWQRDGIVNGGMILETLSTPHGR